MKYNLVGIDTIRFSVSEQGFNTWLRKNSLAKLQMKETPLQSHTLKRKVQNNAYVRLVRYNYSYPNKLCNYLIISKKRSNERYFVIELAGLHQPTNAKLHKTTYQIINQLLKKYIVESIDLAFDFIAKDETFVEKENVAALLASEIVDDSFKGTTYFAIGADYSSDDPISSVWDRDSILYHKYAKERYENPSLDPLWYRLEFRVNVGATFREPSVHKPLASNKMELESLMPYVQSTPIIDSVGTLSSTDIEYSYYDSQLRYMLDARAIRYY